jgi:hypothetical protein
MPALLPIILVAAHVGLAADRVPHFDVAPTCRADLSSRNACRRDEQAALDKLRKQWLSFPRAQRQSCVQLSNLGGAPSYVELLTCLQMAKEAGNPPQDDTLSGAVAR